ncbi:helix-turn-helix domain containing protein, partial [Streptomyces sp. ADI95-17]|uniref:helix-turn-helix domain-containing protein n=3 Tax=Streptomyces TaxID=1883 RepID=UPI001F14DA50
MSDRVGDARAWSPGAQEAVRLLAEGRDRAEVASLFKVLARAVDNWWAKWQADGRGALLAAQANTRPCPRPRQAAVLEHIPCDLG